MDKKLFQSYLLRRHRKLYRDLKLKQVDSYLISAPAHLQYLLGLDQVSRYHREVFILIHSGQMHVLYSGLLALPAYLNPIVQSHVISSDQPLSKTLTNFLSGPELFADFNDLTVLEHRQLQDKLTVRIVPIHPIIDDLRQTKDDLELNYLTQACRITGQVMAQVIKNLKIGMSEIAVKNQIQFLCRQKKANLTPEFDPIVAVGSHSAIPHHRSGDRRISPGDVVLIDFGCQIQGYWSDMTRTIMVGPPNPEFKRANQAVRRAYRKAMASLSQNFDPIAADAAATASLIKSGFPPMPHTTGHGIGLAVHEQPSFNRFGTSQPLKDQTVFTIEPGIYLPGKFGVRYENTLALVNQRLVPLTH